MKQIVLPEKVHIIINKLQEHGYEAFAVGGCVRDSLLGRVPKDWDITTSAKPQEIKELFSHTIDTGIEHGTVTVMIEHEGFEVTTYRIDGEYADARHPLQVEFTNNLREDLRRRDFTINAMAYNDEVGLVDIFEGITDMQNRVIRCVGVANERFDEDALRIMRALRFAAQLNFSVEEQTLAAVKSHARELERISAERIREELTKLLMSPHPEMLYVAQECGLTAVFLPELDVMRKTTQENPHHVYDVGTHSMKAVEHFVNAGERLAAKYSEQELVCLRYAALLHDVAKPKMKFVDKDGVAHFHGHPEEGAKMAEAILRRLKFDNDTIRIVSRLIVAHDSRYTTKGESVSRRVVRRAVNRIGEEYMELLFDLQEADLRAQNPMLLDDKLRQLQEARDRYREILEQKECVSLKSLAVKGKDLIEAGVEPGPGLGEKLNMLLEHVLEYPEDNQKEILLEKLKGL